LDQVIKFGRWIKSIIAPSNQDLKIAVLSIGIATIIWVLSALNENYTTQISCPVKFVYEQEGTITVKEPPSYIQANVSGVGWDILKQTISFNRSPLEINIDNPIETRYIAGYSIQPLLAQHLSSLSLNYIITDSISFEIQELKEKNVFLDVDSMELDMEQFYKVISTILVSPDSATVSGPDSMIDTLSDTLFIPIPIENIDDNINRLFAVNRFNKNLISVQPEEVQVEIIVSRFINYQKEFDIDLVNFPLDSSIYINPPRVVLDFKIQEEYVDDFPETDFIIIADFNNVNLQDSTLNLEIIDYPDYVRDISMDSSVVKVIYEKGKNT
jgi:hypothetical protein